MASNSMITVYLGAGMDGAAIYEQVKKAAEKADMTVSEFAKTWILKGIKKEASNG